DCSGAQIILTQSPAVESVAVGDTVTLNCQSSDCELTCSLAWYLQKPGESPKLLFSSVGSKLSGVPDRVSNSRDGTNFRLKISAVGLPDLLYFCPVALYCLFNQIPQCFKAVPDFTVELFCLLVIFQKLYVELAVWSS
uniref:Immunoglobulin V-set domain-containing protein n=1 Tax=Paramormyrops kingsleyae TaxID=1676925 RepID=A0A3B3TFR8_9TELE